MSFPSARLTENQDIFAVVNEVPLGQPGYLAAQAQRQPFLIELGQGFTGGQAGIA